MLGAIGGVSALPGRVSTTTNSGILARVSRAWHGAAFAHADVIAACLPRLPEHASILALTADDGSLLDLLLGRNPTLRPLDPAVVLADDVAPDAPRPDVVLLADVLHHVEPEEREAYLARLLERAAPEAVFIVKEFAPGGGPRALLGWIADRLRSGQTVHFLSPPELRRLAARAFPGFAAFWTPLYQHDPPNYCLLFRKLRLDRIANGLGA